MKNGDAIKKESYIGEKRGREYALRPQEYQGSDQAYNETKEEVF